jgi:hypothetical protein
MAYALTAEVKLGADQLAIAITRGLLGTHLGVAYRDEAGVAQLFHLGWHKQLFVEPYPKENWLASIINLGALASAQAVACVRGMADKYANNMSDDAPEYGINLLAGHGAITSEGDYNPGPDCDGFTCSSIIAEIFCQTGFPMVDLESWPSTRKNEIWGTAVVCLLSKLRGASEEHVEKVKANICGTRLRPEEFAAAAELLPDEWPAQHDPIQERADAIYARTIATFPALRVPNHISPCVVIYEQDLKELSEGAASANDEAKDTAAPADAEPSSLDSQPIVERNSEEPRTS